MDHFVCKGDCHSVAETQGVCEIADCSNTGNPLAECNCDDGNHMDVLEGADASE